MKPVIKDLGKVCITPEGDWDIKKEYANLSIVFNRNDAKVYISKQCVPKDIDILNTDYWHLLVDFDSIVNDMTTLEIKNYVDNAIKKYIGSVPDEYNSLEKVSNQIILYSTELLNRIQGASEKSSASNDPFKRYPTNFDSITNSNFIEVLDSMHSTVSTSGVDGFWRLYIGRLAVEVKNVAIRYVDDTWLQTIKLPYKWYKSSNNFEIDNDGNYHIHTYYRIHKDGAWGEWLEVEEELKSAITAEENRAKAEEAAIRKWITDIVGESPETLDTIHEISSWILNDKTGAAAMLLNIQQNTNKITAEENRAIEVENQILNEIGNISEQYYEADKKIKAQALGYDKQMTIATDNNVIIKNTTIDQSKEFSFNIGAATTENAGVMTATDKSKLNHLAKISDSYDLNTYIYSGVYLIETGSNEAKNYPIQTPANSVLRLTVIDSYDGNNHVITQVLNINNFVGGEGGIYIRSNQNQTWKPWAKLQTNVEVGLIDQTKMDALTDNGIYSGILSTTGETFVIICINNYAIVQQVGVQHISHLKYSLVVGTGEIKIEKRTRDAYGFWTDWENIGSGSTLPEATEDTLGGVKLGTSDKDNIFSIGNIPSEYGSGLGFIIDSAKFKMQDNALSLKFDELGGLTSTSNGLRINLGTSYSATPAVNAIPLCIGNHINNDYFSKFTGGTSDVPFVPVNPDQFKLGNRGLELISSSSDTKVTWDASSNMNDFKTPGVYDIYGERTVKTDNLPINNDGSGHSIAARLTVVASTLQPANNEVCITQFLQLSNRVGGEGATYIRTYNENNNGMNGWTSWQKQMGMVETLINSNDATVGQEIFSIGDAQKIGDGLNGMIDNGMYSGIYIDNLTYTGTSSRYYLSAQPTFVETFVLVVINDYAASGKLNLPRHVTQLKYAVDAITGQSTVKKRVGTGSDAISWTDWEEIGSGGGSQEVDITDAVKAQGLPYLVAQGLAKEGVNYIINLKYNDINYHVNPPVLLDNDGKIVGHLISKASGSASAYLLSLKLIKANNVTVDNFKIFELTVYELDGDGDGKYYRYIISNDFNFIKVSADMTIL